MKAMNPFKDSQQFKFYQDRSKLKWIVLVAGILISAGSIYYTNILVRELKVTERRYITLFAKTLEQAINEESNLTFLTQEIIARNTSVPLILADTDGNPIDFRNLDIDSTGGQQAINSQLKIEMADMKERLNSILH